MQCSIALPLFEPVLTFQASAQRQSELVTTCHNLIKKLSSIWATQLICMRGSNTHYVFICSTLFVCKFGNSASFVFSYHLQWAKMFDFLLHIKYGKEFLWYVPGHMFYCTSKYWSILNLFHFSKKVNFYEQNEQELIRICKLICHLRFL